MPRVKGGSRSKKRQDGPQDGDDAKPVRGHGSQGARDMASGMGMPIQSAFDRSVGIFNHVREGKSFELEVADGADAADVSCGAQVWVHPTVMVNLAISAGDLIAVSLGHYGGISSEGFMCSRSLHTNCAMEYRVEIAKQQQSGEPSDDIDSEDVFEKPGAFVAIGSVWPSSKLLRSSARLSRQIAFSLGCPPPGAVLILHPLQQLSHDKYPASSPRRKVNTSEAIQKSGISIACDDEPSLNDSSNNQVLASPGSVVCSPSDNAGKERHAGDEKTVEAFVHPCSQLRLEWCPPLTLNRSALHPFSPSPVCMISPSPSYSECSFTPLKSPAWTPQRGSPHPAMSASTPAPPASPLSPSVWMRTPKRSQGKTQADYRQDSPVSTPRSVDSKGTPGGGATTGRREKNMRDDPSDWEAVQALLKKGSEREKNLVGVMIARWLNGRYLLEENLIVVSVCGKECVFRVQEAVCFLQGCSSPDGAHRSRRIMLFKVNHRTEVIISDIGELPQERPSASMGGKAAKEQASAATFNNSASSLNNNDIALRAVTASKLDVIPGKTGFNMVGGLSSQIAALREMVELPLKRPELFVRYGIRPPRGVLLYGPPGTGKTLLARAIANEFAASMYVINGPEIVSECYGESETALQAIFADAERCAPSVVFIDEIDAVAPARQKGAEEFTQRMVAALLTQLDGGGVDKDDNRVVVIAATNRPESIDPALRRPGRFDRELEIGVPTPAGRLEILSALLRRLPHTLTDSDIRYLASVTHGFVGADLAVLCNEAAISALRRIIQRKSCSDSSLAVHSSSQQQPGDLTSGHTAGELVLGTREGSSREVKKAGSSETSIPVERMEDAKDQSCTSGSFQTHTEKGMGDKREGNAVPCGIAPNELVSAVSMDNTVALSDDVVEKMQQHIHPFCASDSASTDLASAFVSSSSSSSSSSSVTAFTASMSSSPAFSSGVQNDKQNQMEDEIEHLAKSFHSLSLGRQTVNLQDFELAKARVRPSAMREVMLEVPAVRWADIGGQEEIKQRLKEAVEWPQKHAMAFERVGAKPPKGILLHGPPGCSKTMMARAVATEAGLNFIAVKGPELFSKWVGESEKAVHTLFSRARASSPSIVFFDEIDGLAVARGDGKEDGTSSVSDRVMSQLLSEMDGLSPLCGVVVIAATNRIDIIDAALLRPGRFDRLLFVGPPNMSTREKIFEVHTRQMPTSPDVDMRELAEITVNFTGADIAAVCREAAMAALEEDLDVEQVCMRHFKNALSIISPTPS